MNNRLESVISTNKKVYDLDLDLAEIIVTLVRYIASTKLYTLQERKVFYRRRAVLYTNDDDIKSFVCTINKSERLFVVLQIEASLL